MAEDAGAKLSKNAGMVNRGGGDIKFCYFCTGDKQHIIKDIINI